VNVVKDVIAKSLNACTSNTIPIELDSSPTKRSPLELTNVPVRVVGLVVGVFVGLGVGPQISDDHVIRLLKPHPLLQQTPESSSSTVQRRIPPFSQYSFATI
jgi:hypothetical protein